MKFNAITLDTNIFEQKHFDFENGILASLEQFSRTPHIDLVISEIIQHEVKKHLYKDTKEANDKYCKTLGDIWFYHIDRRYIKDEVKKLRNIDINSIIDKRWCEFIEKTSAIVINDRTINSSELIDRFLTSTPPFAISENKKYEFTDAIALQSIRDWAISNNKKVLVVSSDNDWASFCEETECMQCVKTLENAFDIFNEDKLIEEFICDIFYNKEKYSSFFYDLEGQISSESEKLDLRAEMISSYEFEEDNTIEYKGYEFCKDNEGYTKFNIIEINDKSIKISIPIAYILEFNGEYSFYTQSEDDYIHLGNASINEQIKHMTKIILDLKYNKDIPEDTTPTIIGLENYKVSISKDIEPDFEKDDWENEYMQYELHGDIC